MNILMTGCSRSIGEYVRQMLTEEGHDVFGVGIGGPHVEWDMLAGSKDRLPVIAREVFVQAEEYFGGQVHALILNAGITRIDPVEIQEYSDFQDVLQVNLEVPFLMCNEYVYRIANYYKPPVKNATEISQYRIVATSSMGARMALRNSAGYCASKAGLEMLMKVVARENTGNLPLTTCSIALNSVEDTDMLEQVICELVRTRGMTREQAIKYNKSATPMGRGMQYDEVWEMFNYALFNMPSYCSGTVLEAPGGSGF